MHNPLRMHFLSWVMSDGLSHSAHFLRVPYGVPALKPLKEGLEQSQKRWAQAVQAAQAAQPENQTFKEKISGYKFQWIL